MQIRFEAAPATEKERRLAVKLRRDLFILLTGYSTAAYLEHEMPGPPVIHGDELTLTATLEIPDEEMT